MALITDNLFVLGARGMVGNQIVYRIRKGRMILSKRPRRTENQSDVHMAQMLRFKEATIYAKAALTDEDTRKAYAGKAKNSLGGLSAYNVAVADFLNAPLIGKIDLDGYSGQPGEGIVVSATDDFRVKEVTVEICQSDDTLVEKGIALAATNGLDWIYMTQSVNASLTGCRVTVRVTDLPGNVTVKEEVI